MNSKIIARQPDRYEIYPNVSENDLEILVKNENVKIIQFSIPLKDKDIHNLNNIIFSKRHDIILRVYGHYQEECNLSFLTKIPLLKKFTADCLHNAYNVNAVTKLKNLEYLGIGIYNLDNFDFLSEVNSAIKELHLHATKSKKPKIDCIKRFTYLEHLYLEGQQKGIECINTLKNLQTIVLRSISTNNLNYLIGLDNLWSVSIKLGGIKNFDALKHLPHLKYLELWLIRNLSDISFISNLFSLQNLFLQSLRNIKKLPSFNELKNLQRIWLQDMKGLKDLYSLEKVPNLKDFMYIQADNQEPKNLLPILNNSSVQKVWIGFGSNKKNNEFDLLLKKHNKQRELSPEYSFTYR